MQSSNICKRTTSSWVSTELTVDNLDRYLHYCNTDQTIKHIPSQCRDYLEEGWSIEMAINSWKLVRGLNKGRIEYLESNRKSTYLYQRLENVSWRNYSKAKLQLKGCSPHKLQWNREEDYYWLFGPNPEKLTSINPSNFNVCSRTHLSDSAITKSMFKKEGKVCANRVRFDIESDSSGVDNSGDEYIIIERNKLMRRRVDRRGRVRDIVEEQKPGMIARAFYRTIEFFSWMVEDN